MRLKALAWGPGDSGASMRQIGRSNKFVGEVTVWDSVVVRGPGDAQGEVTRMVCRADGLWGRRGEWGHVSVRRLLEIKT